MIKLRVDDEAAIPLSVDSSSAVSMTVSEAFIDRGGSAIQNNKNATPSTSQVVVTPDQGFDGMAKVTVAAIPPEYIIPSGTKSITANGEDQDVRQYEYVDVNVPGIVPTGTKTIATNGSHDVTNYATASVAVPASAVDSGTKSITANGNGQDVVGYAAVNVNVPNSYAAADEGKVVQSGALVSQSSQTIDTNGTYDTTLKNEVVVDVQSGGGGRVLLASLTALQNEPTMSINYDAQTMGAYKIFEMEVTGTSVGNLYICPQLNGTSNRGYWGNYKNAAFYRRFIVAPTYDRTGLTIVGYNVDYGNSSDESFWLASNTITSFYLRSYYDTSAYFGAGTVFNVYGYSE